MLLKIPRVVPQDQLGELRAILARAQWRDGGITAGPQAGAVKNNRQLPEDDPVSQAARAIVLRCVGQSALFFTAALPKAIFPPLFNLYAGSANAFGTHIDNAVRIVAATGQRLRTDLSVTLFLSEPDQYDGGELMIEDHFGAHAVKLAAGDLVLYPSSSLHRVAPVTRGARMASFFWIQSMVRETEQRRLLFELDMSILQLRTQQGECEAAVRLTGCYHNLLRMWAEP